MDAFIWALLAAVLLLALFRFQRTRRNTRVQMDKEQQIRRKIEELRRKRDEDNGAQL